MVTHNCKLLVLVLTVLVVSPLAYAETEETIKLKSSYTTGKEHPADDDHDDEHTCFIQNEHIVISYFKIKRYETDVQYDAVHINIVPTVDVYDVLVIITLYGNPEISIKGLTDDRIEYWDGEKSANSVMKFDDYSKDSGEEYFYGHNVKYRIQIAYKLSANGGYHNVVYFVLEDTSITDDQRLDMLYAGTDGGITFESYFNNTNGVNNGTASGSVGGGASSHKLSVDAVFQVVLTIFIGMLMIQVGIGLFVKFQNAGAEFGAGLLILIGCVFIVTAFEIAIGVVESVLDALNILAKPADWTWSGIKKIGDVFGL